MLSICPHEEWKSSEWKTPLSFEGRHERKFSIVIRILTFPKMRHIPLPPDQLCLPLRRGEEKHKILLTYKQVATPKRKAKRSRRDWKSIASSAFRARHLRPAWRRLATTVFFSFFYFVNREGFACETGHYEYFGGTVDRWRWYEVGQNRRRSKSPMWIASHTWKHAGAQYW